MGNEACDLDSAVSALTLAFFLSSRTSTAIPIIPIPANDLILRTEIVYFFKRIGLDLRSLIYLDDLDLAAVLLPFPSFFIRP